MDQQPPAEEHGIPMECERGHEYVWNLEDSDGECPSCPPSAALAQGGE